MSENNLAVKITADVANLNTNLLAARARIAEYTAEWKKAYAASATGLADPATAGRLQQLSGDILRARNQASEFAGKLREAGISVGGFGSRARAETAGIGGAFESMAGTVNRALQFTGIALAVEGIHKIAEAITEVGQRANDIRNMSEVLGVTGTQFQAMQIAAEKSGIGAEQLFRAMEKLVNLLHEARDGSGAAIEKIKELGVSNQQIRDKSFDAAQMMAFFSARLADSTTAAAEQEAMLKVLGPRVALASRAIKEMGSDVAVWNEKVREANGLTDDQNKRLSEIAAYWAEVGTKIENAKSKLVLWMAEVLKGTQAAELMAALTKGGGEAGGGSAQGKIDRSGDAAALVATQAGNAAITKDTLDSIRDQIEATKNGSAERLALVRKFYQDSLAFYANDSTVDKVKEAHRQLVAEERQHGEELKREAEKASAQLVTIARAQNAAIAGDTALTSIQRLERERDTWISLLANDKVMEAQRLEVAREFNAVSSSIQKETSAQAQAIARSDANTNIAIARLSIEAGKQALDEQLAAHQINAMQKLAILRQFSADEFSLNLQALNDELGLLHEGTAEYERVYNQIRELKAKLVLDMAALDRQAAAETKKEVEEEARSWQKSVGEIESAESAMLGDLLAKRKSFGAAALQFAATLVNQEIQNDVRAITTRILLHNSEIAQQKAIEEGGVLYHTVAEATKTGATRAGVTARTATEESGSNGWLSQLGHLIASWFGVETAKTAATTTGVATRTAAQAAGDATGAAQAAVAGVAQILTNAAVAASGAAASVAAIPFVGWAMAPEVGAAIYAETAAYAAAVGFNQGAWEIPHDMRGVTVHAGETILPRPFAEEFRANGGFSLGGRGGDTYGDTHINNHFNGANMSPEEMIGHIVKAMRNFHPAFRPR